MRYNSHIIYYPLKKKTLTMPKILDVFIKLYKNPLQKPIPINNFNQINLAYPA